MSTVLYLGMADDIMAPLLLVPDIVTLYVIDKFDFCFSPDGTWNGQKEDIVNTLKSGDHLKTQSKILSNKDNGKIWKLKFMYDNREINLIFYHHRDFIIEEWPDVVKDVSHVISIGSYLWLSETVDDDVISMLNKRTTKHFWIYADGYNHLHFQEFVRLKDDRDYTDRKIAKAQFNNIEWIKQLKMMEKMYVKQV